MKKLKAYIALFLFFSSAVLFAQSPGYLGKKFYIGYNFNFFPYTNFWIYNDPPEFITWANKHEFSASYALGRKCSFSVSYAMCKQSYYFREQNGFIPQPNSVPIKADFLDFRLKIYGKNFIAPVGFYHQLKFGTIHFGLNTPANSVKGYYTNYYSQQYAEIKADKIEYSGNRFAYGIGSTKMIGGGRMYFDIQLMYTLLYFNDDIEKINYESSSYNYNTTSYVKENLNLNVRGYNRMEILVGLGVLIF